MGEIQDDNVGGEAILEPILTEEVFNKNMKLLLAETSFFGLLNLLNVSSGNLPRVFDSLNSIFVARVMDFVEGGASDLAAIPCVLAFASFALYGSFHKSIGETMEANSQSDRRMASSVAGLGMAVSGLYAFEEYLRLGLPSVPVVESADSLIQAFAQTTSGSPTDIVAYSVPIVAGGIFFACQVVNNIRKGSGPKS